MRMLGSCRKIASGGIVVLALLCFAFTGTASATVLHCGDVITADTTLTHDVGPCATSLTDQALGKGALTIRASGTSSNKITLDLNGHQVYGCDAEHLTAMCNQADVTVNDPTLVATFVTGEGPGVVIDREDWVQITDNSAAGTGTVRDFDTGIVVRGGTNNLIEKLKVKRNVGTAATDSDYGEGIGVYSYLANTAAPSVPASWEASTNNVIRANTVGAGATEGSEQGNGPYGGIALYNFDDLHPGPVAPAGVTTANTVGGSATADGNAVKDNYVVPNGTTYQDDGIRIEPGVTNTTVQNNEVSGSSLEGIAVFAGATGTSVLSNSVHGNGLHPLNHRKGDGIRVFLTANDATVTGNTATGNGGSGIRVDSLASDINGNSSTGNCASLDPQRPCEGSPLVPTVASQSADLFDGQTDLKCGNVSAPLSPNHWGNVTANTFGTRNRQPSLTGFTDCIK